MCRATPADRRRTGRGQAADRHLRSVSAIARSRDPSSQRFPPAGNTDALESHRVCAEREEQGGLLALEMLGDCRQLEFERRAGSNEREPVSPGQIIEPAPQAGCRRGIVERGGADHLARPVLSAIVNPLAAARPTRPGGTRPRPAPVCWEGGPPPSPNPPP